MKKILTVILLAAVLLLPGRALAQSGQPTAPGTTSGTITGTIENQTPSGTVPQSLDLMLHAWDEEGNEKLMEDGKSTADGSFRFDNVAFDPGLVYGVMLNYNDVSYMSEYTRVQQGQAEMKLKIPIYEATGDASTVKVENMHTLFYYEEGGLRVTQVFIFGNTGQKTVKDAVTLPSGRKGSVQIPLPENAGNVQFRNPDQAVLVADGFVVMEPIQPGSQVSQVVVAYTLPFDGKGQFSMQSTLPVDAANFMVPKESGLVLQGQGLQEASTDVAQLGPDFQIFARGPVQLGETLKVSITGKPSGSQAAAAESSKSLLSNSNVQLAIGGGVLGLAFVVVGILYWKRTQYSSGDSIEDDAGDDDASDDDASDDDASEEADSEDDVDKSS